MLVEIIIATCVIFAPTFIAYRRNLRSRVACFWINLLLGWAVIAWLPLLAWSILSSVVEP